ncbi:unnamed protein product [Didymodactylos carnosus]|nr:unnamed protein product [Didymodactylos carnosus]CAF3557239.1 unnamed protein product [Didymodactylos carnosus]
MENMNITLDPCEDFFSYACGGWYNNKFLSPSESSYNYFKEIYRKNLETLYSILKEPDTNYHGSHSTSILKAKQYYNVCMNTYRNERTAEATMKTFLTHLGKSPLFVDHWSSSNDFDLLNSLLYVHKYKMNPLFRVGITVDDKNNDKQCIYFEQSGLSFDQRSRYYNNDIRKLFKTFGASVASLLRGNNANIKVQQTWLDQVDQVFLFEKRLSEIFERRESLNPSKLYNVRSYNEIQSWFYPWLNIDVYLYKLFQPYIQHQQIIRQQSNLPYGNTSFFQNQRILVPSPRYFQQLNQILLKTPVHIIANYISLQVVQELLPCMPQVYLQARKPLLNYLKDITEERQQWELCVKRTDEAFGFATGALFIYKAFDQTSKKKIKQVVEEIRTAFIDKLPTLEWMDPETRKRAHIKATMITDRLGYPDWLESSHNIDKYYENLHISFNSNTVENVLRVRKFYKTKNLEKFGQQPDIEEWKMTPTEVNAYYAPWKNMIVFPAGILQTPFFDANIPISLNFGSIGSIVAHELIHGFDASGRYFDEKGNRHNWWQTESVSRFDERTKCFVQQYSKYKVGKKYINGLLTLDENIADNGGVRISYTAYKRYLKRHNVQSTMQLPGLNLTEEQLFFLGFAQTWCIKTTEKEAEASLISDTHSFPKYRVIGTVSNIQEFSDAFQCPQGTNMNPNKKCRIWFTATDK